MGAAVVATALTTLPAHAADVLPGFTTVRMCEGLTGATALASLPDGRILIAEQTGAVRMLKENQLLNPPAITLPTDSTWERGVLGLALAPGFPSPPHVFVHWTVAQPGPHLRLSRFTLVGDTLDPASELILLEGSNQNEIRASMPAGHQGGGLAIGPDGCLYAAVGEMTTQTPSQQLNSLLGKILRIRTDGSIPEDNPFVACAIHGRSPSTRPTAASSPMTSVRRHSRKSTKSCAEAITAGPRPKDGSKSQNSATPCWITAAPSALHSAAAASTTPAQTPPTPSPPHGMDDTS
jgi:hypothetical protein